jgi:hypothetical protein
MSESLARLRALRAARQAEPTPPLGAKSDTSPPPGSMPPPKSPSGPSGTGGWGRSGRASEDSAADFPASLPARYRRAAIEAGSITWRDQVLLWPADMCEAWQERAAIIEDDTGLPRGEAEGLAYLEFRQNNVSSFPTEEPNAEGGTA